MVFGPRLGDLFLYQSPTGVRACHFQGEVLSCAYTIGMVKFKLIIIIVSFHCNMGDSKCSQVSRTLHSILTD